MTVRHAPFAAALLILGLPWLLGVFILAKAAHGQALVSQHRRNRHGRLYRHWRFRTAPPARPRSTPGDGAGRFATYTVPPLTRVGVLIYRTRTDELPALWNVVAGDIDLPEFLAVFAQTTHS